MENAVDHKAIWLRQCHLPADYFSLTPSNQRRARLKVLGSWYDRNQSNVLITSIDNYLAAHRLWVDWYLKTDEWTKDKYFWRDPKHKYEMLRIGFGPPKHPGIPSKTCLTAPRGSTKTVTFVFEACSMIAICRPKTGIIVSEVNKDLTQDKLRDVMQLVENNEVIHEDFGGPGKLYPISRYGGERWKDAYLSFEGYNGSYIAGVSIMSAHRGRHPDLGIIDDPDDGEKSINPDWRKKYFRWLLRTYSPMFRRGGIMLWIQTVTGNNALCRYVMEPEKGVGMNENNEFFVERDPRLADWKSKNFKLVLEDKETGKTESVWEDYISVDTYHDMRKNATVETLAEYQGIVVPEGAFVFKYNPMRHGFMWCVGQDGAEDYFFDLKTEYTLPWRKFVSSLWIGGGGDFAMGQTADSDLSAAAILGIDKLKNRYILDCYNRRVAPEEIVEVCFGELTTVWKPSVFVWEKAAMQSFIIRWIEKYRNELLRKGLYVPVCHALTNEAQRKPTRIIGAVQPLLIDDQLKFLQFGDYTDRRGNVHVSKPHPRKRDYYDLMEQMTSYTTEGAPGHDDVLDAVHMVLRHSWTRKGVEVVADRDPNQDVIEKWSEIGIEFDKSRIPLEYWTEQMRKDAVAPKLNPAHLTWDEHDPYDF